MSTNNDGWIKMSERKPTKFPVWCYNAKPDDGVSLWFWPELGTYDYCKHATHWKPAAADIPAPPREKTRGETDDAAFQEWREVAPTSPAYMAWHAALAYERAEVGKMLPPVRQLVSYGTGIIEAERAIEAIRARCGGAK